LTGRICIVEHVLTPQTGKARKTYTALFLNARHNKRLAVPKHKPLFCGPFERIKASIPRRGDAAFNDPSGIEHGLWNFKGGDLEFEGLKPPAGQNVEISHLADLNAIYGSVEDNPQWNSPYHLLRASDPRRFGVAARLSLAGFSDITTIAPKEDLTLAFHPARPGMAFEQSVHVLIECTARFPKRELGPTLLGATFDGCGRPRFDITGNQDIRISMSNLCHCAALGRDVPPSLSEYLGVKSKSDELELDDEEFVVNYELLLNPPPLEKRPVPFRKVGAGGRVPECYRPSRLHLESEA
jgi:hypothetical protein